MQTSLTRLTADDGTRLVVHIWLPEWLIDGSLLVADAPDAAGLDTVVTPHPKVAGAARPRGIIVISHGMAEHASRYARFAASAVEEGYAVLAGDHRGHGATAAPGGFGFVAEQDGWDTVVADMSTVMDAARRAWPDVPVFLMGHSWGSFLARDLAARRGGDLAGLILLGTGSGVGALTRPATAICAGESRLRGPRHPSRLLNALAFGPYQRHFAPNRTEADWISRDAKEVDRYVADPWCGFVCTSSFFRDLVAGQGVVNTASHAAAVPAELPMLLASGDRDPVGAMGRGVQRAATLYRRAGVREVSVLLYPGGRHELLNETNRDQVTGDILTWIDGHVQEL